MWKLLAIACLSVGQGPEIVEPRTTYGHLGATRPMTGVLPGDVAHFAFQVKGLQLDKNGRASYSVAIEVRDDKGKLIFEQKPFNAVAQNFFGGNSLPVSAHMDVPSNAAPGDLKWKVTVKDRLADKSVEANGVGKVLPKAFGLVRIGTFADPEAHTPVPPVGVVGGTLYLDFAVTGFGRDPKSKKPDVQVQVRILDDKKNPTLPQNLTGRVHDDIAQDATIVPLQYALTLNRPGTFTVELSARCAVSNSQSQVVLPIRILPLD